MKHLFVLLFSIGVVADENPYSAISNRNAFELTQALPPASTILDKIETPKIQLFLTGVTRWRGETKAHMYSKDLPNKYLSLKVGEQSAQVRVLSISRDVVKVVNNGDEETLSFLNNKIPTTFTSLKGKATVVKRDSKERNRSSKDRDKESSKKTRSSSTPSVVKVPSRRSQVDPRIIEKSLEYISKMEDDNKREALLKRVESLQSGQHQIKSNIDQNERRRQYDEWRKRREQ